jgi:hypothetical protein
VHEGVGILVAGHVDQRLCAAARRLNDVGELDCRRDALFRVVHPGQHVEPRIGHFRDADVDVTLAAGRLPRAGHQLEKGCLAAGWKAYERRVEHEPFSLARGV